jgi:hypothetical protein
MATEPGVPLTGLTDTADLTGGTVLVPDATADGQPVAYDQAAWRLNAGTFTGNVVLTSAAPSLEFSDTNGTVDQRRWVLDTIVNALEINRRTDAGVDKSILRIGDSKITVDPLSEGVWVDMSRATEVDVPTPTDDGNAATKAYVDQAIAAAFAAAGVPLPGTPA